MGRLRLEGRAPSHLGVTVGVSGGRGVSESRSFSINSYLYKQGRVRNWGRDGRGWQEAG